MSKESCDFAFRVIKRTDFAELGIGIESVEKSSSGVKVLASTTSTGLIDYPIEKAVGDDIRHRNVVSARWKRRRGARTFSAAGAAVLGGGAAVTVLAAAQVRSTTTVLSLNICCQNKGGQH